MTNRPAKRAKHKDTPQYAVQNCTFTSTASAGAVSVAAAIARAAEANAIALQRAAEMLKGPDALLKMGCS